mmetsp:Transcript_1047/g.2248  ORF Transcript_1047/g.2248 Transcript_1047/m.2248 type:complete len:533 (-) Transcript_1047:3840-5438(-)
MDFTVGFDIVKEPLNTLYRRTKIICTIGPANWSEEGIGKLIDAGMNVARFNFSHGDHERHQKSLDLLREVAASKSSNIAVLVDTTGPEIRTGYFDKSVMDKLDLERGQELILTGDYSYNAIDSAKVAVSYDKLAEDVKEGQQILIADGALVLTVLSCDMANKEVTCRVENNVSIGERKNVGLPDVDIKLPTFSEKDIDDIVNFGIKNKVDCIAASLIRTGEDVRNLRKLLADNGGEEIKIISKIGNQEGMKNYDEIIKETDGIMIARGSLGMDIPPAKLFLAQKYMIRKANLCGKPVITATQMLESMLNNPRPTRAECSDVANSVFDGTDCVMLSGETAVSPYFEQAVQIMSRTVTNAEQTRDYDALYQAMRHSIVTEKGPLSKGESVASSAVSAALDTGAKLIVILSDTGKLAGYVGKFRPAVSSLVLTPNAAVARTAHGLMSGVHSILVDSLEKAEELMEETMFFLCNTGMMNKGDKIIFMAGRAASLKERLMIDVVTEGKSHGRFAKNDGFFNSKHILKSGTYDGMKNF